MEIIYSGSAVRNHGGRKGKNPKFFTAPVAGATKVYINGHWPNIEAAYRAKGVEVLPLSEMPQPKKSGAAGKSE